PMLEVQPILGTVFTAEEETPGKDRVVVISEGFWKRRFGSDPNIAGKDIQLNQESYKILGVIPTILEYRQTADLYTPLSFTAAEIGPKGRGSQSTEVIGRLKPGVSLEQANAEIQTVAARVARENPANYPVTF